MSDDVQRFHSNLPKWTKFFDGFRLPPTANEESAIAELQQRLANIRRRLRDGPDAPIRLAFFGPTGAGKSKLFGSLIRDNFSGSGFKRPFTRESFYYVHDEWKSLVAALEGEVSVHDSSGWKDTILIDTPDFDSVEEKNRAEAERVFLECDAFLFVTDALKYADASTWEYLEKIYASGKDFAVILNKVKSDAVSESFRERFERTLGKSKAAGDRADYPEVIVPEFRIDDATLIDADHESMKLLQKTAQTLVTGESPSKDVAIGLLTQECESFCTHSDELRSRVTSRRTQIEAAKQALTNRAESSKRRLESRLTAGLEPTVRDEVYNDVLQRLEKIDLLRYPRQLISMPIRGIRSLFSSWMGGEEEKPPEEPAFADPISSETFHMLEAELISFADQSRNDIVARPGLEKLIDRDVFKTLRFDHDQLKQMYIEHHEQFANWVASNAEETASEITTDNKAKFVLSQVLFNTILITGQVAVGGFNPLYDTAATSVISPMVAKGISMAIGNEKVKEFEEAARAHHQESLARLVDQAKMKFVEHLDDSCEGLDELEQHLNEISASRSNIDSVVRQFQGLDRKSEASGDPEPYKEEVPTPSNSENEE